MCIALAVLVGCEAPPKISPGLSAVRIQVWAEPKTGYSPPPAGSAFAYDPVSRVPAADAPFERVDYLGLDDIIVWVEPKAHSAQTPPAPAATIDVSVPVKPGAEPIGVTSVGGQVTIRNRGRSDETIYSLSAGNEADLGSVPRGGIATLTCKQSGWIELLAESQADPVAAIFVAPTPWVQRVRSGRKATFTDLPPGPCRVFCTHRRLPGSQTSVELQPDQLGTTSLRVGVNALPKVP